MYFEILGTFIYFCLLHLRILLWTRKVDQAKLTAKSIELKILPPTVPALELRIKRRHYQAMMR